ncbi:hypothetical protein ABVK25_007317 [Lepraria finkii]|uniref:F-box domain-containing protein n=1 Tax=Lepraria finkii TaxID=1340010 RepID=A0ABR4B3H0_9LECA
MSKGIVVPRDNCTKTVLYNMVCYYPTLLKVQNSLLPSIFSQNTQVLLSLAMPTTTLSDLPPELGIIVFKSFGEFTSATALVRTSHKFYSVWEDNPSAITNAILPRAIKCFDQATERLEADDKLANNQRSADATHPAIQGTKQSVANAIVARRMRRHYERAAIEVATGILGGPKTRDLKCVTPTERTHLIQATYRAITVACCSHQPLPYDMLASLDMLELHKVFVALVCLTYWIPFKLSNPERIQLALRPYYLDTAMRWYARHDSPALGVPISEDGWLDTFAREAVLLVDLQNAAHNIRDARPEQLF